MNPTTDMRRVGTVHYHVHKTERQAFRIDEGGVAGTLVAPELVATEVEVEDVRAEDATATFKDDSVFFAEAPTEARTFSDDESWRAAYDAELASLLSNRLAAKEVVVFDHTVRVDSPDSERRPARNVHTDYSEQGARKRLVDILGQDRAGVWAEGHYGFVNVWRPIGTPISSAPLGFIRPKTVAADDWISIDLVYPDRVGQIMGLVANTQHEWIYCSRMTPDEVAVFNIYDNRGLASVGHSAIDLARDGAAPTVRHSIESRTLVRY